MAYVETRGTKVAALNNAGEGFFAKLKAAIVRRRLYLQTMEELNALSDRELNDLAISRGQLRQVAYDAAYGK